MGNLSGLYYILKFRNDFIKKIYSWSDGFTVSIFLYMLNRNDVVYKVIWFYEIYG
jgi:hypothetical protein